MIGTSSAQKSMFFLLSISCYFSSSALVLLVSMDDGKHIYASELQLSTRFPFLCQDRFPEGGFVGRGGVFKRSPENAPMTPQTAPGTPNRAKMRPKCSQRGYPGVPWASLGSLLGCPVGSLGRLGVPRRVSWRSSGVSWEFFGVSWVELRLSWGTSEPKCLQVSLK